MPARDAVYANCDTRLKNMLEQGGLTELEELMTLDLAPNLPIMKARRHLLAKPLCLVSRRRGFRVGIPTGAILLSCK